MAPLTYVDGLNDNWGSRPLEARKAVANVRFPPVPDIPDSRGMSAFDPKWAFGLGPINWPLRVDVGRLHCAQARWETALRSVSADSAFDDRTSDREGRHRDRATHCPPTADGEP